MHLISRERGREAERFPRIFQNDQTAKSIDLFAAESLTTTQHMKSILLAAALALSFVQSFGATGRQLSGPWAPATTPALAPDVAQKKFTVPQGFEVRLFASE